jgi:hypothetical protein
VQSVSLSVRELGDLVTSVNSHLDIALDRLGMDSAVLDVPVR